MSWQKCPVCNGEGVDQYQLAMFGRGAVQLDQCTVCHGKKIIDTVTGLPPKEEGK